MNMKIWIAIYAVICLLFLIGAGCLIHFALAPAEKPVRPTVETQAQLDLTPEPVVRPTQPPTEPTYQAETLPQRPTVPEVPTVPLPTAPAPTEAPSGLDSLAGLTMEVVYCQGTEVNVRSGPGTDHEILGKLYKGDMVDRVAGENGQWSRVIFKNRVAYVSAQYLGPEMPKEPEPTQAPQQPEGEKVPQVEGQETVYCTGDRVNVRQEPSTSGAKLGKLEKGEILQRVETRSDGWSQVIYKGQKAYVSSQYLKVKEDSKPAVRTMALPQPTEADRQPTAKAPFTYDYLTPKGQMPFGLFTPVGADLSKPLPLIISLHGASEVRQSQSVFEEKFLVKEFRNWEYTDLDGFDAYIVCPHLTGEGDFYQWNCFKGGEAFFKLLDYLKENYHIDEDKIILEGHSMGAMGALYMAADQRAEFSCVVPISAYRMGRDYKDIKIPIRGYSGDPEWEEDPVSFDFMEKIFTESFGQENWIVRSCSHDEIPQEAFEEDRDGNGKSDLVEWMLSQ